MRVVLVFRSKKLKFHSIENVFGAIFGKLSTNGDVQSFSVNEMGFSVKNIFSLRKFAKSNPKDTIYHVTGDIHYVILALPRRRSVLTIHDCVFVNQRKGFKGWVIKKIFLDWPVKYARLVTVISEKTKHEVISLTGCREDKIRVINNPVSPNIRYTDKIFNCKKPVLLFIGALPNKNLNRTIEALKGISCTLNIIGLPDASQREKMTEYGIDVVIENELSNEEMAARYEAADIVVFPSLYEGFGLPVIEGFKAGRAVLTSDISPMKDIADGAAWLVDPYSIDSIKSTLNRIVEDEEARTRKIQAGIAIVKKYSPEAIAANFWNTYNELYSDAE